MRTISLRKGLLAPAALMTVAALVLGGCANNEGDTATDKPSAAGDVTIDEAAAAKLPEDIKTAGVISIGTTRPTRPTSTRTPRGRRSAGRSS